jgi:hypothetical protein
MFIIDFSDGSYKTTKQSVPKSRFLYISGAKGFTISDPNHSDINKELWERFIRCIPWYLNFLQDPVSFLYSAPCGCLTNIKTKNYALVTAGYRRGFVWLFLKPDGQVLVSLLSFSETEKGKEKWEVVAELPGEDNSAIADRKQPQSYQPKIISEKASGAFNKFLLERKKYYDALFANGINKYTFPKSM